MVRPPSYDGRGLTNLVAELEQRLTGVSIAPRLGVDLAQLIPEADTYVLVLFDGLGDHQLDHPEAEALREARRAAIDASFPTTTTVSLSTIATGLTPLEHGMIGYQMWFPTPAQVVNTLQWTTPWGGPVRMDYEEVLPRPNLWERLAAADVEPIAVQPAHFAGSPLSRVLYRGCRFEGIWSEDEIVSVTLDLATRPGRLILTYVPHVDVAAHVSGQGSEDYQLAIRLAGRIWDELAARLPDHAAMIGTSDHGHVDYDSAHKIAVERPAAAVFYGDPRALYVRGPNVDAGSFAGLPARWVSAGELLSLWGPEGATPHPDLSGRAPVGCLLADPGYVLVPSTMDSRLVGYHGGLDPAELQVPLLVTAS
jgi:hypothetical protein